MASTTILRRIPVNYHRFLWNYRRFVWNYHCPPWNFYEQPLFCVAYIGGIKDLKHLSMRPERQPPHQRRLGAGTRNHCDLDRGHHIGGIKS